MTGPPAGSPDDPALAGVIQIELEMRSPGQLRAAAPPRLAAPVALRRAPACPAALYHQLYREVGAAHHWVDRLGWTDADVGRHLADPAVELHLLEAGGDPAGYAELVRHPDGSIELGILGVRPAYLGRGLGGYLVAGATARAWAAGAARVWLTTLTLDHPRALTNYLRRGFVEIRRGPYRPATPHRAGAP